MDRNLVLRPHSAHLTRRGAGAAAAGQVALW